MLDARPNDPTMTTNRGFEISGRIEWRAWGGKRNERTRRAEEAFQRLHRDGEAECQQEDTINESGKDFGPVPAVRVAGIICILTGKLGVTRGEMG